MRDRSLHSPLELAIHSVYLHMHACACIAAASTVRQADGRAATARTWARLLIACEEAGVGTFSKHGRPLSCTRKQAGHCN